MEEEEDEFVSTRPVGFAAGKKEMVHAQVHLQGVRSSRLVCSAHCALAYLLVMPESEEISWPYLLA